MLHVRIRVTYEGDWTAELQGYDVSGQFLASTYRDRRYLGIVRIEVADRDYDAVIDTIQEHKYTETLDVIESNEIQFRDRRTVTLLVRGNYWEYTPLQILLYEGYLPFGAFGELENGQLVYDLLVEDRDSIQDAVELLREFGSVSVDKISQDFHSHVVPSITEWQNLLHSFSVRQREIVQKAIDMGYYKRPRETTLQEIADEVGIAKTTVSQHLRKAEEQTVEFVAQYLSLADAN
ncbi:helix-turn-helix domain-containing protein [Halorussus halophilus]|uniref:helix-turn-helix domain-containing protein n=1 Tax=Halorussus halophilus TaxID=2650975 RepID=UPI00130163F4|nr:helix-turn-helix domain-containing protein [Halorussus halophilus]